MRLAHLLLACALMLPAGRAWAWPYEVYPVPKDLGGYRVAATIELPEGKAELLVDGRITADNTAKVRTILLGGDSHDSALQDSLEREDPRWAIVRFKPAGGDAQLIVLDHALANLAAADIEGSGTPRLEVTVDYLQPHRGRTTLFMQPVQGRLEPVQYVDAVDGYKMQIELIDADKAWWKDIHQGKASQFLLVDARFPDRTDLMRIRWDGRRWLRTESTLPAGAVKDAAGFPGAAAFP